VSELELFLDHFRSALGDARRSGIERLDGPDKESPLYGLVNGSDDHAPLDDRVEWGVWGVLSSAHDVDTRSLLKRSYGLFRGIETPDRELVERCIAAYGVQGDDGRWRLRDEDTLAKRQLEQTLLAASLIDAGHRIGFKVQIGRELRRRPLGASYIGKANVLADLLSDLEKTTPLARALRGPADVLDAVDLAWYDRGKMVFLWQLDWTARLHRSLSAIGEQIPDDDRVVPVPRPGRRAAATGRVQARAVRGAPDGRSTARLEIRKVGSIEGLRRGSRRRAGWPGAGPRP